MSDSFEVGGFGETLTDAQIRKILFYDLQAFARLAMPDYFTTPFAPFHKDLFRVWGSNAEYVMLVMPRGFGKTTTAQMLCLHEALYQQAKFILFVGSTAERALEKVEDLKKELEENDRIRALFGDQVNPKHWLKGDIQLNNGVIIKSKGAGQSLRGVKVGAHRPDLIVIDDLENDELGGSREQCDKLHNWLYRTLFPSAVRRGKRVRMMGTIIESESLITRMIDEAGDRWKIWKIGQLNDKGESIWPAYMSTEEILALKKEYEDVGQLAAWYREYQSTIVADDASPLPHDKIKVFPRIDNPLRAKDQFSQIIVSHDPAISTNPKADRTAIFVVGFKGAEVHVLDGHRQIGMPPEEQTRKALEFAAQWRAPICLYESVAFQEALRYSFDAQKLTFLWQPQVVPIRPPRNKSKQLRIEHAIRPRLFNGNFHVAEHLVSMLKEEMVPFPAGKRDCLDSIAQAISYQDDTQMYYKNKPRKRDFRRFPWAP